MPTSNTIRSIQKNLMISIKALVDLFPDSFKKRARNLVWLHNLYAKNLQKSGFFYGFPSPEKLQKLYSKIIEEQNIKLDNLSLSGDTRHSISLFLLLDKSGVINQTLIEELTQHSLLNHIYIFPFCENEKEKTVLNLLFETQNNIRPSTQYDFKENELILVIRQDDRLHKHALKTFLHYANNSCKNESLFYCDTDYQHLNTRKNVHCYPDWNPDLLLSSGYLETGLLLSGRELISDFYEFLDKKQPGNQISMFLANQYLRSKMKDIERIPFCLIHKSIDRDFDWFESLQQITPPNIQIKKNTSNGKLASVSWLYDSSPLVSLIVPTKNAKALVQTCLESIIDKTSYQNYEILLVDNQSDDPEAIEYFNSLKHIDNIKVLSFPFPFNYSAINNFAVKHAKGEIIGLINNDIEVISPNWLSYMVGHVTREDIGCVGAKLLYPDNRIQHAGVVMGYGGGAGHAHKYFPRYHSGYLNRLAVSNNFSAVTAACLLVKKRDYLSVNGLNDKDLKIAFNDVDFCLKVKNLGRRNLYCAEAELYHHESVSRGREDTKEKQQRFMDELSYLQNTWQSVIEQDDCYNPNLTLKRENFAIKEI